MKIEYTYQELRETVRALTYIFNRVLLVDPVSCGTYQLSEDMADFRPDKPPCYHALHKRKRCEHCGASNSYHTKSARMKFEFIDESAYLVISNYIICEGKELVLEIISDISNDILLDAQGQNAFIERITAYNMALYTDALTGVFNRRYTIENIARLNAQISERLFSLALVDIDHFKSINDTYGHFAGDVVLSTLAKFLASRISQRRGDFVVRYGGDEFLLVFCDLHTEVFGKRLEELVYHIDKIRFKQYPDMHVTVSIGGVSHTEFPQLDFHGLMLTADERLYQAKKQGRNRKTI